MLDDNTVFPRERKTRKDIMTVYMAIVAKKSSKDHKLKPRSIKRDRTKLAEAKRSTVERKNERAIRECC